MSASPPDPATERQLVELKALCANLTAELARVQKERTEYLQNVSHQLVAPLNAMKWHIENLTEGRIGVDRARKILRSVYSQATMMVHLANNFALMSNLEADHTLAAQRKPLEPISLEHLLACLAADFEPLGWDKDIEITLEPTTFKGIPDILAIKPLITQIFTNILENAIKYADSASAIVISAHCEDGQAVTIDIANKGIGVEAEFLDRIFDRGFRTERARNTYPPGTGYGLYIAKKLVEIHRGRVSASMNDKGQTVFSVQLHTRELEGLAKQWPKKSSS